MVAGHSLFKTEPHWQLYNNLSMENVDALETLGVVMSNDHTAEAKRRLLAKCNASRRQIVNFFRNLSKYRLKKGQNVQFMSNRAVHGTIVHLTSLHTWNLQGKA